MADKVEKAAKPEAAKDAAKGTAKTDGKKAGGKKLPILLIGAVVAALVIVLVGHSMFGGKAHGKEKKKVEEVGISLPLDEFLVNLNGGGDHYLKATFALGLNKSATEEGSKEKVPAMRDAINSVLALKSLKDIQKDQTHDQLKEDIKNKVNAEVAPDTVVKVYVTQFATQ